jgi:hypothetical protein
MPGRAKHDLSTFRSAFRRVACQILGPYISLGLNDAPDAITIGKIAHEIFAKQLPGDIDGGLLVKGTRQFQAY